VIAMTNADTVALFLNGEALGEQPRPPFDYAQWEVPYAPGRLEAVAYRDGGEVARAVVETAGEAVSLALAPDREWLAGDGCDALPVTVSVVDACGRVVPGASHLVTFTVSGLAENIGHGNGDHNCHDPEKGPARRVFHGLAQLIVRSRAGIGLATIRADAEGLSAAEAVLEVRSATVPAALPSAAPRFAVAHWRVSPPQAARPDPTVAMSEADMNTWMTANPGALQEIPSGQWLLYRAVFRPWRSIATYGGELVFGRLHGSAEFWLDGRKVAEKTDPSPSAWRIPLPPAQGERSVTLLMRPGEDGRTGLAEAVGIQTQTS